MSMNEFRIVAVINRPLSKVFAAMEDFEKVPHWNPGVTEVRLADEGPVKVGTTVVYVGKLSADMRTSPVADKFLPADGHEISPAAATSSPQN